MTIPPYKLASPAPTTPRQSYVYMLIYGPTDSGKSTLAATAPGPMLYTHGGGKVEGLIQRLSIAHKAKHGYRMGEYNFSFTKPPDDSNAHRYRKSVEDLAAAKWKGFCAVFEEALLRKDSSGKQLGWARTILIDTEWVLYTLIRMAYFGGDRPDATYERDYKGTRNINRQHMWGELNSAWYTYLRQIPKGQNDDGPTTNIVLVTHASDEWVDDKKTGVLEPKSQGMIPRWVDCSILTRCDKLSENRRKYYAEVDKCWYNNNAAGVEIEVTDSDNGFEQLMFEITDSLDWGE